MISLLYLFTLYLPYWIGGGPRCYRLVALSAGSWRIEMRGGGTGPFWYNAHFLSPDYTDYVSALRRMTDWAKEHNGSVIYDFTTAEDYDDEEEQYNVHGLY